MNDIKVGIINIGNELLLGKTVNSNLAYIGKELSKIGIFITESIIIPDEGDEIKRVLSDYVQRFQIIISTGGLGPTKDDITKQSISEFFKKDLEFVDEIWENIKEMFSKREIVIPEINKNQALVPEGFTFLKNSVGTAPGLFYEYQNSNFFALPGVPLEMEYLIKNRIIPIIQEKFKKESLYVKTLNTYGISESKTAEDLEGIIVPEGVNIAWLPQTGRVDIRIYGENSEDCMFVENEIRERLSSFIWGEDETTIIEKLHTLLKAKSYTISTAESCTGGMLSKILTDYPGSSSYFKGGIIAYDNAFKERVLGIPKENLSKYGAVSEEIAIGMVEGLSSLYLTDFSLSITGIAGPDGGSTEKPVGLVYMAIKNKFETITYKKLFIGTRDSIRFKAAEFLLYELMQKVGKL